MTPTVVHIGLAASLFTALLPCVAQATPSTSSSSATNATWTRAFAVPFDPKATDSQGSENGLTNDPRFGALLKIAFPQRQWFWFEHGRLVSTADLIITFIGVPGDAILDDGRYITADGCVPHDCDDRGMLWIDTGAPSAGAIFVATNPVFGDDSQSVSRLWIFSSTKLNWQHLPPSFLASLTRWLSTIAKPDYRGTPGYSFNFVVATIVQPNGVMKDLTPQTLHLRSKEPGAKQ